MGTFTDQVQGIAREQKNARLERERKAKEKAQKELYKMELYNILERRAFRSSANSIQY